MKKHFLLVLFVAGALFGCQQNEAVEAVAEKEFTFQSSITGDLFTRSQETTLDVVSVCEENEKSFSVMNLLTEKGTWSKFTNKKVNFLAHYPQLADNESSATERLLENGVDYLFGSAEAEYGSKNVALQFKRVNVPVYIKVKNANGVEETPATIKVRLKKSAKLNLKSGKISANNGEASELIKFNVDKKKGEILIIPQEIPAGTIFEATMNDGTQHTAVMSSPMRAASSSSYRFVIDKGDMIVGIIDPVIPL